MEKIRGKHVVLRPVLEEDYPIFASFMNDVDCSFYIMTTEKLYGVEDERRYFTEDPHGKRQLAIVYEDHLVGLVELFDINWVHQSATMGIHLGPAAARGKGLGEDALRLILDYGFYVLNLHSIRLTAMSTNRRALALYKKVGFKEIGRLRQTRHVAGQWEDTVIMDILAEEHTPYVYYDKLMEIFES